MALGSCFHGHELLTINKRFMNRFVITECKDVRQGKVRYGKVTFNLSRYREAFNFLFEAMASDKRKEIHGRSASREDQKINIKRIKCNK